MSQVYYYHKNTNLAGLIVIYDNSFWAVLQGSYYWSHLFNDYLLEVEKAEFPVSEIFASKCALRGSSDFKKERLK